jgi:hypothetical protein
MVLGVSRVPGEGPWKASRRPVFIQKRELMIGRDPRRVEPPERPWAQ